MILDFFFITIVVLYVLFAMGNHSFNRKLVSNNNYYSKNILLSFIFLLIAIIRYFINDEISLGDIYLFVPFLFLVVLRFFNWLSIQMHQRHHIVASKVNMASEETQDAKLSDYIFFFIIYLFPLILPLFIYDVILGNGLLID